MDDDEVYLIGILLDDLEDAENQALERPRLFFRTEDPHRCLNNQQFMKHFRLDKNTFNNLLAQLTELLEPPNPRVSAISLRTKLLVALMFYGQGSYQAVTGSNTFTGMSQASVSRCIEEITNGLNTDVMLRRWIQFPQNIEELTQRRARFYNSTHLAGGIGVVDCTHVAIVMPREDEHIYVNRKNYHSINVQLVCDENLKIMHVNARFPGSTHDAYIWQQSNVSRIMENIYRHDNNNNFYILGDSGYPLRPWLITPLRDTLPDTPEERFNNHFKSVRSIIERCNGVLKNRFRCLLKHRVLHYEPEKAAKIIMACAVLHNICTANRIPEPHRDDAFLNEDLGMIDDNGALPLHNTSGNDDLIAGRQLRHRIAYEHFN